MMAKAGATRELPPVDGILEVVPPWVVRCGVRAVGAVGLKFTDWSASLMSAWTATSTPSLVSVSKATAVLPVRPVASTSKVTLTVPVALLG